MKWSLCIATLDRRDALLVTLCLAATQTRPPSQIVVVDVSDDWQTTRDQVQALLASYSEIALHYGTHGVRSSATQRNAGLALCEHDIVFMIDDDSFLYPTCAEEILAAYAADPGEAVASIAATLVSDLPEAAVDYSATLPERKASGRRGAGGRLKQAVLGSASGRWVNRHLLLQSKEELFLKYDEPRDRQVPPGLAGCDLKPVTFMPGCAMTVRRAVALAEPFDTSLRYYAAFEDLDVAYRYARHGAVLQSPRAWLHHFEAASGRVKRKKVIVFQLLNMLVFLKRHAAEPEIWLASYRRLLRRRLIGEALKDLLAGRLDFPQLSGVRFAIRHWRQVWGTPTDDLDRWYPEFQKDLLDRL